MGCLIEDIRILRAPKFPVKMIFRLQDVGKQFETILSGLPAAVKQFRKGFENLENFSKVLRLYCRSGASSEVKAEQLSFDFVQAKRISDIRHSLYGGLW